ILGPFLVQPATPGSGDGPRLRLQGNRSIEDGLRFKERRDRLELCREAMSPARTNPIRGLDGVAIFSPQICPEFQQVAAEIDRVAGKVLVKQFKESVEEPEIFWGKITTLKHVPHLQKRFVHDEQAGVPARQAGSAQVPSP